MLDGVEQLPSRRASAAARNRNRGLRRAFARSGQMPCALLISARRCRPRGLPSRPCRNRRGRRRRRDRAAAPSSATETWRDEGLNGIGRSNISQVCVRQHFVALLRPPSVLERPGDVIGAAVGTVGGAADRHDHRFDALAVVGAADDLAFRLLGSGASSAALDCKVTWSATTLGYLGGNCWSSSRRWSWSSFQPVTLSPLSRSRSGFLCRRRHAASTARGGAVSRADRRSREGLPARTLT